MLTDSRSQKGFTLLEVLVVLTVLSVLLAFSAVKLQPAWEMIQKRIFLSQFQSDLYYAHSYAISKRETVIVVFHTDQNRYTASSSHSGKTLFVRDVPSPIQLRRGTLTRFHITPSGTVSTFGIVYFDIHNETIEITFYIGRGRFHVK